MRRPVVKVVIEVEGEAEEEEEMVPCWGTVSYMRGVLDFGAYMGGEK